MKQAGQGEETVINHNLSLISVIRRKPTKSLSSTVWPDRFKSKIALNKQTGCWDWTGATKANPKHPEYRYPVYSVDGTPQGQTGAHQFAYQFAHGLLLPGLRLDVDHACQNKLCVNPNHLRPLTHRDNCQLRRKRQRIPGSTRWIAEQRRAK